MEACGFYAETAPEAYDSLCHSAGTQQKGACGQEEEDVKYTDIITAAHGLVHGQL